MGHSSTSTLSKFLSALGLDFSLLLYYINFFKHYFSLEKHEYFEPF